MKYVILFFALTISFSSVSLAQKKSPTPTKQKKKVSVKYDESDALGKLYDYYTFYNANYTFRKETIRQVSNNVFYISLEECINKKEFKESDFFWRSKVLILTINSSTKYTVKEKGF